MLCNDTLVLGGPKTIEIMDSSQSIVKRFHSSGNVDIKDICFSEISDTDSRLFVLTSDSNIYTANLDSLQNGDIATNFNFVWNMNISAESMFYCESKKKLFISSNHSIHSLDLCFDSNTVGVCEFEVLVGFFNPYQLLLNKLSS